MHSYIGIDSLWVHVVHHGYKYDQDKCSKGLKKNSCRAYRLSEKGNFLFIDDKIN